MSDPNPTIFVHIGLAKTGTTYLQGLVWRNKQALADAGVLFPGRPGDHFLASNDLLGQPFAGNPKSLRPGAWEKVAAPARTSPDRALITQEILGRATPDDARRAIASLAPGSVHVIVTVRDLSRQIPAVWQERVKNGSRQTYTSFLEELSPAAESESRYWRRQDASVVLSRWGAVPPEHVHIVTVPPSGARPRMLWERFASVLGVDPQVATKHPPRSNTGLGVVEAELLRVLNATLRPRAGSFAVYARAVKHHFATEILPGTASADRIVVPPEHRDWVSERGREIIERLKGRGYDVVGDLADLEPTFAGQEFVSPADVPKERLLEAAAECVTAQLLENDQLRRKAGKRPAQRQSRPVE
ncbi:MAG: hypothetical protein GEU93_01500 [Propionibacteriales bacterium]|nr:hypothetical protein [Propionibacteriales bacterium]